MAFEVMLNTRIDRSQMDALQWYAEQTESGVAEIVRYFLPSSVPEGDDLVEVHAEGILERIAAVVDEERHRKYATSRSDDRGGQTS